VLVGDHLLLRDFERNGIIFMNVCVTVVTMVMLLKDFEPYEIIFRMWGNLVRISV
jgi:hypothetical protein